MADVPQGWYPNPEDPSEERWWDGSKWTLMTRPTEQAATAPSGHGAPPTQGGQRPLLGKPDNGLVPAILVTLFCCLPFGIAAIVNAARVDGLWAAGDHWGAMRSAKQAKKWTTWSLVSGGIIIGLYLLAILAGRSADGVS